MLFLWSSLLPFSLFRRFSGNARPLLLPFFFVLAIFGQCRPSAFTLFLYSGDFRAMHDLCFYPFSLIRMFAGNAVLLLLPFFFIQTSFGQCSASAFTLFLCSDGFRVMHDFCFYPFSLSRRVWGNARLLLLPFFFVQTVFG